MKTLLTDLTGFIVGLIFKIFDVSDDDLDDVIEACVDCKTKNLNSYFKNIRVKQALSQFKNATNNMKII